MNKSVSYAIAAMVQIAAHRGRLPLSSTAICEVIDVPPRYLLQILRRLSSAGLLKSLRGIDGGYKLAKPVEQISLLEIHESVGGSLGESDQSFEGLTVLSQQFLLGVLADLADAERGSLSRLTLGELQAAEA